MMSIMKIANEQEFSQKITSLGGTLYIVGGWVRDMIRGAIA